MPPMIFYKDKGIRGRGVGLPQGILVPRQPDSLSVVASDAFTDTDGTAIGSHTATGGGTWANHASFSTGIVINGNRAHNANDTSARVSYHSLVPATADYDVAADVVPRSDNDVSRGGIAGRIATGAVTMYYGLYSEVVNAWTLFKVVAGSATQLGSNVIQTLTVDQAYRAVLSMRGDSIRILVDGNAIISVTDSAITAAGRAGIRVQGNATSTTGIHLDNFEVRA